MKSKLPLLLIILFSFLQICFSQSEIKPILFIEIADEYCSEYLAYQLDMFSIQLNNNPDSRAYIIFHGRDTQEGKNLSYLKYFPRYLSQRFNTDKIITIRGENKDKMTAQLWVIPNGAKPPIIEKSFVKKEITSTTLFDKSWADWHKAYNTEWTIYGYSFVEWGCEMDLNMEAFAETLRSQSNLTGYLVVYPKFGKGKNQAKKVTDFAIKELTRQYKVPKERLKTIYGGNRNRPELELWFVRNGGNPPIPNPDKFIKEQS